VPAVLAAPAAAQQTPATYCASLPATSCEVLNVEPISIGLTSYNYNVLGSAAAFLIKQCRNKNFETRIVVFGGGNIGLDPFSNSSGSPRVSTIQGAGAAIDAAPSVAQFQGRTSTSGYPNTDLALGCL